MNITEKRKSVRIPVDFPASFSYQKKNFPARVLNLSIDGAMLQAEQLIDTTEVLLLTFELPEQEIRVKAKVMWGSLVEGNIQASGMGVRFEDIPALQQAAIELYIRNLLKM
jgi:hypothetical protein